LLGHFRQLGRFVKYAGIDLPTAEIRMAGRRSILCISSYFKGNRFLQRAKREGARVFLLTAQSLRDSPWDREHLDDVFLLPNLGDLSEVIKGLAFLMRTHKIDLVVALDDYDVELAAALREHFRLPGVGLSAIRHFRDKLAMRLRAREIGLIVPEFVALFHHEDIRQFLASVPPPWLMKPRHEASSIGIKKLHSADEVWQRIDQLGDDGSYHVLERFVPSDLYHVDSLVVDGQVVFAEVGAYHKPLLEVWAGGGVFATRTAPRDAPESAMLRALNAQLLPAFGLLRGCSHTEFLRGREDGRFYFLETSYRVGGACISDMVEAATGLNLWEEWAAVELAQPGEYHLPILRQEFGGAIVSLARQEKPDTSSFCDPEIFYRLDQKHHIGLVVRAPTLPRVEALIGNYSERIVRDYQAVLPPAEKATA
jgi:glutathione synthase/RimK-type ligase-like ATP-grasp enzyme